MLTGEAASRDLEREILSTYRAQLARFEQELAAFKLDGNERDASFTLKQIQWVTQAMRSLEPWVENLEKNTGRNFLTIAGACLTILRRCQMTVSMLPCVSECLEISIYVWIW